MPPDESSRVSDPFTQFWSDAMSRMGMAAQPAPPAANDAMKQMQRVFLDALAKYCDDFMRSPMFLDMMRQHMTNALGFQQQVNQFLTQAQRGTQPAATNEAADLVGLVRSLRDQVERLERKAEGSGGGKRTTPRSPGPAKKASSGKKMAKSERRKK